MMHKHCHFIFEFLAQYMQLVKMYSMDNLATMLVKNIGSSWFNEQQLITNYATIFVIPALDVIAIKRLIEIHNKRIEGQNFATNFEVCVICVLKTFLLGSKNNETNYRC